VNPPHWYEKEPASESDSRTWNLLTSWKGSGKPVIVGEQGNSGQNWDEGSALRMRIRAWTAFFAEGTLVFWNTSTTKSYQAPAANIYLGSEERRYLRVLQDFTRRFDPAPRVATLDLLGPGVRGYALSGPSAYAAYLDAAQSQGAVTRGVRVRIRLSKPGMATWIEPASGWRLARQVAKRGLQTLAVPPFVTDVALKIRLRRARG
jgi:hypothetical protein